MYVNQSIRRFSKLVIFKYSLQMLTVNATVRFVRMGIVALRQAQRGASGTVVIRITVSVSVSPVL